MALVSRASTMLACLFLLTANGRSQQALQPRLGEALPGLTPTEQARFVLGREAFDHIQTEAEGAGPVMNVAGYGGRCLGCHSSPVSGGGGTKSVRRFGVAATGTSPFDPLVALGGPVLQTLTRPGCVAEVVPPQADVVSVRITPPLFGFGLVEAIVDADIQVREALPPPNVSGRANLVTPVETPSGPMRVGRFGWKALTATLLTFSGDACLNDLGISNRLFPLDNSPNGLPTAAQPCDSVPDPEDGPDAQGYHKIDRMSDFMRFLAPPPQTPRSGMSGEASFIAVGCANCHVATPYVTNPTSETALANKTLKPYSDFLLHDMGTLGDGIPDGLATEHEFRTPPLWGVLLRADDGLLHDARAVSMGSREGNVNAAIMAHDGEASASRLAYSLLSDSDRLKTQRFLLSLGRAEFDYDLNELNGWINDLDWFFMRPDVTGPGSFFDADDTRAICDIDQDGDIDLRDIAAFQRAFEGS